MHQDPGGGVPPPPFHCISWGGGGVHRPGRSHSGRAHLLLSDAELLLLPGSLLRGNDGGGQGSDGRGLADLQDVWRSGKALEGRRWGQGNQGSRGYRQRGAGLADIG